MIAGHDRVGVLITTNSQIAMFKHCVDALHHVIDTEGVMSNLRQVSFICVYESISKIVATFYYSQTISLTY